MSRGFARFLLVACLGLTTLCVLLVIQNHALRARTLPPTAALASGDRLSPLTVLDDSGAAREIRFEGRPRTVLLLFTSDCPACRETLPLWTDLFSTAPPPPTRVVGIQLDDRRQGSEAGSALPFEVYGYERRASGDPLSRIPGVPALVLVDDRGVVLRSWFGVPGERELEEIRTLSIRG